MNIWQVSHKKYRLEFILKAVRGVASTNILESDRSGAAID